MTGQPRPEGRYRARIAETVQDVARVLELRALCFRGDAQADDRDAFDARCLQVMVEETATGRLVCCYRLLVLSDGGAIGSSYAAQFYDLQALAQFGGPMVEMGRFCILPGMRDPDILRVAWALLTQMVDSQGIEMLFGCSSFIGTEEASHRDAFALLSARHIAPRRWLPRIKAPDVVRFGAALRRLRPDMRKAMGAMPPLLRTYLTMGGWVSDHAVVDRDLGTMHVFTGLEIAAIPPARKRLLRAVTG